MKWLQVLTCRIKQGHNHRFQGTYKGTHATSVHIYRCESCSHVKKILV
ncbi:hypothetical protein [Bacillus taeanensis]|nr:hypothetical protein [Bacillus taeanensis]